MKTLELFSGTESFSNAARERGHQTFTSDFDPQFDSDYTVDIMQLDTARLPFRPDVLWASPPCETFSVASLGRYWWKDEDGLHPRNDIARAGIARVERTLEIIDELQPKVWIIENPRGALRKMKFMQDFARYTVTYCQYGDVRMKPTDLWSNVDDLVFKPICKNGAPCHIAAPRGSQTGTQGPKSYLEKSRVPHQLCVCVVQQFEERM
jgi:hypothetical protein